MNCQPTAHNIAYAGVLAVILGIECWMGKTDKVKASSLLEFAFMGAVLLWLKIKQRKVT